MIKSLTSLVTTFKNNSIIRDYFIDKRYHFTEFSSNTWIAVFCFVALLTFTFAIVFFLLFFFEIEAKDPDVAISRCSIITSIDLCLRTSVNIAPDNQMTSMTYKVIIITSMMFGFVIFSHYEALLATTLIVESDNMPYKSWIDVLQSGQKVLVWQDANSELKFKVPPSGSVLRQIYDEQIEFMNDIGYKGSVPGVVNDDYALFESLAFYELLPEYPCQITAADSYELR